MPENRDLPVTQFPMTIRFGEEPKTTYKNNLKSIRVTLQNAPKMKHLRRYLADFATATWEDNPLLSCRNKAEKDKVIRQIFKGEILPSAMETIKLTFLLEGISYQDVSHILRYRTATFSAECSADKWWSHKNVVIPTSIENSPEFYARYVQLHEDMKKLYVDMIDSQEISLIDARYVLTRAMETYYWVSMDLATALNFIRHRIDKQIQPESDNVLAYRMYVALIEQYPLLVDIIDIHAPAAFYVKTARTGRSTNLFIPDEDSDIYEWNKCDYLYRRTRDKVCGTDSEGERNHFQEILDETDMYIAQMKVWVDEKYGSDIW